MVFKINPPISVMWPIIGEKIEEKNYYKMGQHSKTMAKLYQTVCKYNVWLVEDLGELYAKILFLHSKRYVQYLS